jgi:hypothetical protein
MKIALCISGETREYNQFFGPDTIVTYLRSRGYQVDVYGHTWEHCENPRRSSVFDFKKLQIDNQDVLIRDWVNVDPSARLWGHNLDDFEASLLETRKRIGQHVGGLISLQMPPVDTYDLVVRWRWDLQVSRWFIDRPEVMDYLVGSQFDFCNGRNTHNHNMAMTSNNSWINKDFTSIEDVFFILTKLAHEKLKTLHPLNIIADVWEHDNDQTAFHILWNNILLCHVLDDMSMEIPNFTHFAQTKKQVLDWKNT